MRLSYPRSFLSLLVIGFTIVAAPLLFALLSNALAFERLAEISERTVHSSVKVAQASRSLVGTVNSLERSARQYAVAGELTFLEAYRGHREGLVALLRQLGTMTLSDEQHAEVAAIERQADAIHQFLGRTGPTPALAQYLQRERAESAVPQPAYVYFPLPVPEKDDDQDSGNKLSTPSRPA